MQTRLNNYIKFAFKFTGALLCGWLILIFNYGIELSRFDKISLSKADAIVVLTGGQDRISGAAGLLVKGFAQRLFLTGVGGGAEIDDIIQLVPTLETYRSCCISLGYDAQNTRGNAAETDKWARKSGYNSLIIVTSLMHLPRAKLEFQEKMPNMQLQFYPAGPTLIGSFAANKLLFIRTVVGESFKYSGVIMRTRAERLISIFSQET